MKSVQYQPAIINRNAGLKRRELELRQSRRLLQVWFFSQLLVLGVVVGTLVTPAHAAGRNVQAQTLIEDLE